MTHIARSPRPLPLRSRPAAAPGRLLGARGLAAAALATSCFAAGAGHAQPAPAAPPAALPAAPPAPAAEPRDAAADLDRELEQLVAQPGGLTAAAAGDQAAATSYDVAAARASTEASGSEVAAARLRYAPRLTLSAGYTRLSPLDAPSLGTLVVAPTADPGPLAPTDPLVAVPFSFPVYLNQTTFRASLVVPLTDYFTRFPQALDAAEHGRESAQLRVTSATSKARAEAQIAYYSYARAALQQVAVRQARERATQHLRDVERAHAAGLATLADLKAVEAQVAQAEVLEARAGNNLAITADHVRAVLHQPPSAPLAIGENVLEPAPASSVPPLESAWAEARRQRPELAALRATERQLRRQADATRAGAWPRVDAVGEVVTANPNQRYQPAVDEFRTTWSVGVQATWTVNDVPTTAASRRGLEAQARNVAAQRAALEDALRAEIVGAARSVEQANATIAAARRGLEAAEVSYQVRRDQYRAGRATSVDLTDAETDLTRARIELIDALLDARIARVRLDHALGRDVRP